MTIAMQYGGAPGAAARSGGGSGGGVSVDLLWTNPSPTASFAAKTVSVDLSGYDFYAVKYRFSTTGAYLPLAFMPVDDLSYRIIIGAIDSNRTGARAVQYSTADKTISFGTAGYNANANNNGYVIPVAIYGVKL